MKSLSMKKSSFKMMDCFDTNATVSSIMYSRCLLYIVLFVSLINMFYIINLRNTYSLVIFFLVGFITSFFVKNMIIIILFATFVSLFFQSITHRKAEEHFSEGFQEGASDSKQEESEESEDKKEDTEDVAEESEEIENSTGSEGNNVGKLKQNMKEYYEVQNELIKLLEKAEPLQQRANKIKEKFNSISDSKKK